MGLLNQLSSVLGRSSGNQSEAGLHSAFDQVTQGADRQSLANGLGQTFRSQDTPPFAQLVSHLFNNSNPEQKTGLLNTILSSLGPGALSGLGAKGGGLSNLISAFQSGGITSNHAQQVSAQDVHELASHAESQNPSVVDSVSQFYSQHSGLIKTLGPSVLQNVMGKMTGR
jgi:hypothetical protein